MTDGNLLLKQYELEDKIAGQRLEIKRLRQCLEKLQKDKSSVNHGSPSEEKEVSFIEEVQEWEVKTFPDATVGSIQKHLREEAGELYDRLLDWERHQYPVNPDVIWPTMLEEFSDVFLVMCHLAKKRGFDLLEVISHKFTTVKHQKFEYDEQRGYYKRVKEEPDYGQQDDMSA